MKKRRLITLASAILLAICFFLPSVEGCEKPLYPYKEITDISDWTFGSGKDILKCLRVFEIWGAAYLFGLLLAIIIICGFLQKRLFVFIRKFLTWILFVLVVSKVSFHVVAIATEFFERLGTSFSPPIPGIIIFAMILLIHLTIFLYSLCILQHKYTLEMKLCFWQLLGSLLVAGWFWYFLLFFVPSFAGVYSGLWLSVLSSTAILICSIIECKAMLNRPYKTLLFGILKLDFPDKPK